MMLSLRPVRVLRSDVPRTLPHLPLGRLRSPEWGLIDAAGDLTASLRQLLAAISCPQFRHRFASTNRGPMRLDTQNERSCYSAQNSHASDFRGWGPLKTPYRQRRRWMSENGSPGSCASAAADEPPDRDERFTPLAVSGAASTRDDLTGAPS